MMGEIVITKDMFERYLQKQALGDTNMWSVEVERECNLSKEEHLEIIKNYAKYVEKFGLKVDNYIND